MQGCSPCDQDSGISPDFTLARQHFLVQIEMCLSSLTLVLLKVTSYCPYQALCWGCIQALLCYSGSQHKKLQQCEPSKLCCQHFSSSRQPIDKPSVSETSMCHTFHSSRYFVELELRQRRLSALSLSRAKTRCNNMEKESFLFSWNPCLSPIRLSISLIFLC